MTSEYIKKYFNDKKNNVSFIHNDIGYHKIEAKEMSISLHLYSPPNYKSLIKD